MSKLKLAIIEDDKPVRLTLEIPAAVHRDLIAYEQALSATGGRAVAPEKLIVPMVTRFMATDRGFIQARRAKRGALSPPVDACPDSAGAADPGTV